MFRYPLIFSIISLLIVVGSRASAQEYVGSSQCGECHETNYNFWAESGHHFSLNPGSDSAPDFPFQYHSGTPNVPSPPLVSSIQLLWNEVTYVVGGYYREAIFTDQDGYIITGDEDDATRWDVWDQEWVAYHPNEQLSFDCARCHATGYDTTGHQAGLPGITGTWAEDGIGCEACHGPDS
jgi:hypothetical protein